MSTTPTAPAPSPPLPVIAPAPPPPAKRPSVADRVARAFPPLACVRGYRYFAKRRVDLADVSESGLDAEVKGQRVQHVRLRVQDGHLASGCTCAAKLLGPAACRHVWATLLEVDRQGAFDGLRSSQRALALTALAAPDSKRKAKAKAIDDAKPIKAANAAKATKPSKEAKPVETSKPRGRARGRT
ncbi:MAG: hypothetical protein JWO86_3698 [Myxococcaceae bacterium]|nr:hypothetical protein [Myxococcaceae bacterium]MEA2746959.1 hypothetical protein [Myxococcales bacterium]